MNNEVEQNMSTQLINELKVRIDEHLADNLLTLNPEVIGVPNIDSVFEAVFNASNLAISDAIVMVSNETLTITGKATFLSTTQIPLTVEFKDINGVYQMAILPQVEQTLSAVGAMLFDGAFPIPQQLAMSHLIGVELPTVGEVATVRTQLNESLDLGGGLVVLQAPLNLTIEAANILQPSPSLRARLAATVTIAGNDLQLSGEFAPGEEESTKFRIEPGLDSLGDLVEQLFDTSVAFLEGLSIADLQIGKLLVKDEFELSGRVDEAWSIPLGPTGLEVKDTEVFLKLAAGNLSGTLRGKVSLAGATIEIESDLASGLTLSGRLPDVGLLSLIDELAGSLLTVPSGFPDLSLLPADFQIQPLAGSVRFLLQAPVNNFGMANLLVTEIDNEWEAAILFVLPDDWKFSALSNWLSPLDVLPITAPRLALASFSASELTLPVISGEVLQAVIQEGLSLSSNLRLQGLGLDFIGQIIDKNQLPLQLAAGNNLANSRVRASFEQTIEVFPSVIVLNDMGIDITPDPFVLEFASLALVTVAGNSLPEFKVRTGITEDSTRLIFQTNEPWNAPFGISNLTINKLVLQMESGPPPKYAVLGDIAVASKTIEAAVELVGNFPSMIFGQLDGELSLAEVINELVKLSFPEILNVSIEDFMLRAVGDPMGVTIGDEHFESGLTLQGTLGFLGLEMFTKVVVDPDSGVFAHASLSEKVELGNVLTISNADGDGPPSATLDTSQPPFLQVSGMFNLLGLKDSLDATIDDSGMVFTIEKALGPAQYTLSSTLNSATDFRAEGSFNFGIKEKIGPLEITPGVNLGEINLQTGFTGEASISVIDDQFNGFARGSFEFQGLDPKPEIRIQLSANGDSLEKLPEKIIQEIIQNAKDIFADLLRDADKWLLAIRDGVIEGVEHVAIVLKDEFNRSAEQIGKDIRDTLDRGSKAAAQGLKEIGESPERIAKILKDLGDSREQVIDALCGAGFGSDIVLGALTGSFPGLNHIDVGLPAVNKTIRVNKTVYPRTRIPLHVDETPIPHHDARPHIDHQVWPRWNKNLHLDKTIFHTDIDGPFGSHADERIHADAGVHGDVPRGHGDVSKHVNIPAVRVNVSNHADIPAGHADVSQPVNVSPAHVDENIIHSAGGHIDQSLAPHQDKDSHLDKALADRKNYSTHLDKTVAQHQDRRIPLKVSTPHQDIGLHISVRPAGRHGDLGGPHLDVAKWHGDKSHRVNLPKAHGDLSKHVDLPAIHADESLHVDIPGTPGHVDIPLCE